MNDRTDQDLGPWNPGLSSKLPAAARALSTVYRPENVAGDLDDALERSAFTGLEPEDLVAFRPERLVVHELLIRVTGDFSVPDGRRYADLGINFRNVVDTILKSYILPEMTIVVDGFETLKRDLGDEIGAELDRLKIAAPPPRQPSTSKSLFRWLGSGKETATPLGDRPRA